MSKRSLFLAASLLTAGAFLTIPQQPVRAQASKEVQPERALLGVRLGRPFLEVIRKFGQPSEVQTVALAVPQEQLPALGGATGAPGMEGMPGGYPGGMGAYPGGAAPFGGGSPFGGVPTLPPAGGAPGMGAPGFGAPGGYPGGMGMPGYPGAPGAPGGFGGFPGAGPEGSAGYPGAPGAAGATGPEYSNAILWIYKRPNGVRLEFLINEDGRVAQISVAAPAGKTFPNSKTARNVALGSTLNKVMESYGYPERHRMLPGLRFYEVYYTKNHHAAFTLDTTDKTGMKVVRITIALAD